MADNRIITTKKARPGLGKSAQAKWSRKQQAHGRCRQCGKERPPELKQLCRACQDHVTNYMREYRKRKKATNVEANRPIESTTEASSSTGTTDNPNGATTS